MKKVTDGSFPDFPVSPRIWVRESLSSTYSASLPWGLHGEETPFWEVGTKGPWEVGTDGPLPSGLLSASWSILHMGPKPY